MKQTNLKIGSFNHGFFSNIKNLYNLKEPAICLYCKKMKALIFRSYRFNLIKQPTFLKHPLLQGLLLLFFFLALDEYWKL